jgi:uncharacterized protein (DUF1330 family)
MSAYVIMGIEGTYPAGYKEYKKLAPPAVILYESKYLVRGGPNKTIEGN